MQVKNIIDKPREKQPKKKTPILNKKQSEQPANQLLQKIKDSVRTPANKPRGSFQFDKPIRPEV